MGFVMDFLVAATDFVMEVLAVVVIGFGGSGARAPMRHPFGRDGFRDAFPCGRNGFPGGFGGGFPGGRDVGFLLGAMGSVMDFLVDTMGVCDGFPSGRKECRDGFPGGRNGRNGPLHVQASWSPASVKALLKWDSFRSTTRKLLAGTLRRPGRRGVDGFSLSSWPAQRRTTAPPWGG